MVGRLRSDPDHKINFSRPRNFDHASPLFWRARELLTHLLKENTPLAIQQVGFLRREYFDSEKSDAKVKILTLSGF